MPLKEVLQCETKFALLECSVCFLISVADQKSDLPRRIARCCLNRHRQYCFVGIGDHKGTEIFDSLVEETLPMRLCFAFCFDKDLVKYTFPLNDL